MMIRVDLKVYAKITDYFEKQARDSSK